MTTDELIEMLEEYPRDTELEIVATGLKTDNTPMGFAFFNEVMEVEEISEVYEGGYHARMILGN